MLRKLWYRPRHSRFRFWMFQVHLYTGLALALLTTVIGISGSLIVYKPETERLEAGAMSKVDPAGKPRPLSELYPLAQSATANRVERLYIWGGPSAAYTFRASRGGAEREYIYIDQYRARVQGVYPMDATPLQSIYDLHDHLLLGHAGLITNGIGALLLVAMCATGIVVWWPGAGKLWLGFRYHWRARWQIQNYDIHKILGIAALVLLAVIAFTGASYAFPDAYRRTVGAITGSRAIVGQPPSHATAGAKASVDDVLRAASASIPGATVTVLTWPAGAKGSFQARELAPGDWARLGDQYVYIDQYTARVLRADVSRRLPAAGRIMLTMSPLHYGTFGGTATRLLWILMGFVPGVLSVTGFLMWWNRVLARRFDALFAKPALPVDNESHVA